MNNRIPALAAAAFCSVALPASVLAATVTVEDITLEIGPGFTLSIPSIEVVDSNLDEAAIRAFFAAGVEDAANTLSTLDAARVVIPEIVVTMPAPPATGMAPANPGTGGGLGGGAAGAGTGEAPAAPAVEPISIVYSGFILNGVTDGVATSSEIGGMTMANVDGSTMTMGRMTSGLLDLGGLVGFYGLGARVGTDEMLPLYRDLAIEAMGFEAPGISCDIGKTTGTEFDARPLKVSFVDLMRIVDEMTVAEASGQPPAPETISTFVAYYVDLFTAFQSKPTLLDGVSCAGLDERQNPFTVALGPIEIGGFAPGIYPYFSLDGVRAEMTGQGFWAFDNFTWKEMDLRGPIAAIEAAGSALDPAWFEANWRKIIPSIAGFSLSGGSFDIADTPTSRVQGGVGSIDVSLADYVNGVPSRVSTSGKNLTLNVPEKGDGSEFRMLGFEVFDLGYDLAMHWDETAKTIAVDQVKVAGVDMGSLGITGVIGNAGRELFSEDPKVAQVAALGLTVREVTIDVVNDGIVPLLITLAAAEERMDPAQFHIGLMTLAQTLPLGILGATPEALAVGQAFGGFLAGSPQLTITLTSVDPNGIGLAEFMAAQENPALLKGKVRIAASVSGEPVPYVFPGGPPSAPALTPDPKTNG